MIWNYCWGYNTYPKNDTGKCDHRFNFTKEF